MLSFYCFWTVVTIRNSTKYVSYKDLKEVCLGLRSIYRAVNKEEALEALDDFGKNWNSKYPMIQCLLGKSLE